MSEPTDIDNDDDEAFAEATLTQAIEIDSMLAEDRPFNAEWYETALRALPELPPEADQGEDE